ncbi:hypothetical protein EET67_09610 [Pseudaminobacter arsenicus]|uniref:Uncharacterized protein n=1 Tax=Borborobacter arsenicus TaxID=1851146 RepID=A0A432V6U4_9HYPH|nr:hypothetical protein [Pseudaminobacter arsenicus]RUM97869.1 hypothetical protein EET67_09610 [Pseudaminobacter arsenicus]
MVGHAGSAASIQKVSDWLVCPAKRSCRYSCRAVEAACPLSAGFAAFAPVEQAKRTKAEQVPDIS